MDAFVLLCSFKNDLPVQAMNDDDNSHVNNKNNTYAKENEETKNRSTNKLSSKLLHMCA